MLLLVPYHGLKFLHVHEGGFLGSGFILQWLHLWRMPLFFAVSGFLAAMTLARWGARRQLVSRLKRIGIPLAVGMVTIIPLVGLVQVGVSRIFHANRPGGPKPFILENVFRTEPMHLWFLSYLLIMSVLVLAVVLLLRRSSGLKKGLDRVFTLIVDTPLMLPVLGLASGSALYFGGFWRAPAVVASSLIPNPEAFLYYTVFFVFGWMLFRNIRLLPKIESDPGPKLFFGLVFALLGYYLYARRGQVLEPGTLRLPVLIAGAAATWLTLFGFWGLFARFFASERYWLRYLADASYWIFLIHVPFLTAASMTLAQTDLPLQLRLVIAVTFSIGLSLATYALFVRYTFIGRVLNGPRSRPERKKPDSIGSLDFRGGEEAVFEPVVAPEDLVADTERGDTGDAPVAGVARGVD